MITRLLSWLVRPYPYIYNSKLKFIIASAIGLFVFLFLYFFRPFEFNTLSNVERLFYQLLYGSITTLIILINFFIFPLIFPQFYKKNTWKVYKEILVTFEIFLVIAILIWSLSQFSSFYESNSPFTLQFFIIATFSIGIIPLTFYIFIEEKIYFRKNKQTKAIKNNKIKIEKDTSKIHQTLLNDFLFIKSKKNYATIYYCIEKEISLKTIRISLNKIEEQYKNNSSIFRCHKSYVVNKKQVTGIVGNSRGYKLIINNNQDFKIPVSRKFSKKTLHSYLKI